MLENSENLFKILIVSSYVTIYDIVNLIDNHDIKKKTLRKIILKCFPDKKATPELN